jgi:hypothetical protein
MYIPLMPSFLIFRLGMSNVNSLYTFAQISLRDLWIRQNKKPPPMDILRISQHYFFYSVAARKSPRKNDPICRNGTS